MGGNEDRGNIQIERSGTIATIALASSRNRNALSFGLLRDLQAALDDIEDDLEIRVVVLTNLGTVFCSGADLQERLHPQPGASEGSVSLRSVLTQLASLSRPVIAQVKGHVRAGGIGLIAACDMAVAAPSVTFAFTEVRVGVAPAVIAVPGLRVMDRRAFVRYALTGDTFGSDEAASIGLLTAVSDDIDGWVANIIASLLRSSPAAVAATKKLCRWAGGGWTASGHGIGPMMMTEACWDQAMSAAETLSEELFVSSDGMEGIDAFFEKRPARWVVE